MRQEHLFFEHDSGSELEPRSGPGDGAKKTAAKRGAEICDGAV